MKTTLPSVTNPTPKLKHPVAKPETQEQCHEIIRELENEPSLSVEEADEAIMYLLSAGYHGRPPEDFDNYLRHLAEELSYYPASTARAAIKQLARTRKIYPSRPNLHDALEEAERERQEKLRQAFQTLKSFANAAREREEREKRKSAHWSKKRWAELEPKEVVKVKKYLDEIMGRSKERQ